MQIPQEQHGGCWMVRFAAWDRTGGNVFSSWNRFGPFPFSGCCLARLGWYSKGT